MVTGKTMSRETELEEMRLEVAGVIDRLLGKTLEIQGMLKDGKFIVAYEKFGGVMKVLQQLNTRLNISCENNDSNR